MITDARPLLRGIALALPILAFGWLALLAIVLRLGGAAPAVLVPFPPTGLVAALGPDVQVSAVSAASITLRSDMPDLVARIYAAGGWLVLPAGLDGCIPAAGAPTQE